MDILDIMLAKAMTPQGQTEAYVAKANKAAQDAAKAKTDAAAAVATVEAAATTITETQAAAAQLLEDAQTALSTAQQAQGELPTAYSTTGQNTDGYMTQKAVTDALAGKADTSTTATKTYVDTAIAAIPASGGGSATINLGTENEGHLVKIDSNGGLTASQITDAELMDMLHASANVIENVVGLDINYFERTFTRTQDSASKTMGDDFDEFTMYGGRTRCNVADDGTINAFYGDNNYREDGSNGQVMVYQPKFYYKRTIYSTDTLINGTAIRHESLTLSSTPETGFKLAPIFNGDLDYVLLPAFDAGLVNDKLTSIAGVKPVVNITIAEAENYAKARGTGWHIMNMAAESANQMLEIVEFGTMNGQQAIEQGITYTPNGLGSTCLFITGSTSSLGNTTGHAASTTVEYENQTYTMTEDGYRAISYRGMENPWGNLWSMVGGINIYGDGTKQGGTIYICSDFNYTPDSIGNNYTAIGFNLPSNQGWINAMGYGGENYDWVYMPIECSDAANSLLPVGDNIWTIRNLVGTMVVATGGSFGHKESCGPFYYGADRTLATSARDNYGAKLMFIPTKNNIYNANIIKWNAYMGG